MHVTLEATRGLVDLWRGIIEATGGYMDVQHYINSALREQTKQQVNHMTKTDGIWRLLEKLGKGGDPEEDGLEFAS